MCASPSGYKSELQGFNIIIIIFCIPIALSLTITTTYTLGARVLQQTRVVNQIP